MFKLAPEFARAIKTLRSPTAHDFDANQWRSALANAPDAGQTEQRLIDVAVWVGGQSAEARSKLALPGLAALGAKGSTLLAIAALNREYRVADELIKERMKEAVEGSDHVNFEDLTSLRITTSWGSEIAPGDLFETAIDSVESWLFDALALPSAPIPETDLSPLAVRAMQSYTWRKTLNMIWNDARYRGVHFEQRDNGLRLLPFDRVTTGLIEACRQRTELNLEGAVSIDRRTWRTKSKEQRKAAGLARSVTAASRGCSGLTLKVKPLSFLSNNLPPFHQDKASLEGSYLADFLEISMPSDPRLSPLLVLKGWHVLRDAAEAVVKISPLPDELRVANLEDNAIALRRSEVCKAMAAALAINDETADSLVEFLTYRPKKGAVKGHKGLWAAPIVPIPESDLVALALMPLHVSFVLRRLEAWLERGGIDDNNPIVQRGDRYEESYRAELCAAVANNRVFTTAKCAADGVPKSPTFPEQVDLLFTLGDLAVVGELKFFLTPSDPHEQERYFRKLEEAAEQADRKTKALTNNRQALAQALGIDTSLAERLELMPIVVTNQGFAFSMAIDGVRIVDAGFLKRYLGSPTMISGAAVAPRNLDTLYDRHQFYSSEMVARRQFASELAEPYVLTKYSKRVRFRINQIPSFDGPPLEMIAPFLAPVDGVEQYRAKAMSDKLASTQPYRSRPD